MQRHIHKVHIVNNLVMAKSWLQSAWEGPSLSLADIGSANDK